MLCPTKLEPLVNLGLENLFAVGTSRDNRLQLSLPLGTERMETMLLEVDGVSEWVNAIRSMHSQVGGAEVEIPKPVSISLKKCPQCGIRFSQEYDYCLSCGTKLEPA